MRVVIVDDQASARAMIASLVQAISSDVEVSEFWDAEEALDWCAQEGPEVVLLDYRMPGLDGLTFIQRLKSTPIGARCAVIMVTSQDDAWIRQAALESGAVVFVRKPIAPVELKLCVKNLLETISRQCDARSLLTADLERASPAGLSALLHLERICRTQHQGMTHDLVSVPDVAVAIARSLKLKPQEQQTTSMAARLYDIGLLAVSSDVLHSAVRISALEDVEAVREHVIRSRELLEPFSSELATIALHVREHYDGSGYPAGLKGDAIPLLSRIVAIASAFCSLVSDRPHRAALSPQGAVSTIQTHSGSVFDPICVNALIEVLPSVLGTGPLPAPGVAVEVSMGAR